MMDSNFARILIVDDNPEIHKDFRKILLFKNRKIKNADNIKEKIFSKNKEVKTFPKFHLDSAYQGQEAINLVLTAIKNKKPYSMAFVDMHMTPEWDGIRTINKLWEIDPDIQIVICTAHSDYSWREMVAFLKKPEQFLILKKPFDTIEVCQLAVSLTEKWRLSQEVHNYVNELQDLVKERTNALENTLSMVKATLESTADGIFVVDRDGNLNDYNAKFVAMWDIPKQLLINGKFELIINYLAENLKNATLFKQKLFELQHQPQQIIIDELHLVNHKVFELFSQPRYLGNVINGRIICFRDITERIRLESELARQATHDALTGLPNRLLLLDRLEQSITSAKRFGKMVAVIFVDLDHFKLINDSLGHTIGDALLRLFAIRIRKCVRESDTVARLSGDEFIILLANIEKKSEVSLVLNKVIAEIAEPFIINDRDFHITASIGIALFPKNGFEAEILLKNADAAMYRAKVKGRNNYQYYTNEMNILAIERLELEQSLNRAIKNNEMSLCYQPQVNVATGKIVAAEALLRWNHPKYGMVDPNKFISIAEESGLIIPLGEWVIKTVCYQIKRWQEEGLPRIRIAINISERQLRHANFVAKVKQVLRETHLDPTIIELEITESCMMDNTDEVIQIMDELAKTGITLAIDDFGTGYSSLSYLRRFPISKLKIDKLFINPLGVAEDNALILAIIALSHTLKLQVVAEGVETEMQLNFLRDLHCDDMQGFYFSQPISNDALANMMKHI